MTPKLIIAETNALHREGILSILSRVPEISIAAVCHDADELEQNLRDIPPDLLILDGHLLAAAEEGQQPGIRLLRHLPLVKTILFHTDANPSTVKFYIESGARGYLLRNVAPDELTTAVKTVLNGESYIQELVRQEASLLALGLKKPEPQPVSLTKREAEILRLIAAEHTTEEIAAKLFISFNTVESHRKNIIAKLGVRNTAGLIREALRLGLIP